MHNLKKLRNIENLTRTQLANSIKIDEITIEKYESGNANPHFNVLLRISSFFQFSIDYLVNDEPPHYPRNLKLLDLASKFDTQERRNQRNQVEANASAFLYKIENVEMTVMMDNFKEELTSDFHQNLKIIRLAKRLTQSQVGEPIGLSPQVVYRYEHNRYPPIPKLRKLSETLGVSAHCLATGRKLFFDFEDRHFCKTMLQADQFLPLEEQKMLIHLMETLLVNVGESA